VVMPNRFRRAAAISLALVTIGAVVACGGGGPAGGASGGPTATPGETQSAGDLPAGWTPAGAEGFSMGVPEGWLELSADDLTDSGAIGAMASANPDLAPTLEQVRAAIESGQILLFAIDTEPSEPNTNFAANVNVLSGGETTQSAEDAASDMAAGIEAQLPVSGEVETDTASLPAGEAGIVRYEWTITTADGTPVDVTVTQYAVIAGGTAHILSFTAATATLAEYGPIFEQMAESFDPE
jgi:hypothetical protein